MRRATLPAVAVLATLAGWRGSARAQSDRDLATRQELITRARDLSDQGKHSEALDLAKRASTIKATPSLRVFLAEEEMALGLLADAYGNARQCAAEAEADTRLHDRDRILPACRALDASLTTRVGRVTVKVPPAHGDVRVTVSGEELNPAFFGVPYVVTPGAVAIAVTSPGYETYTSNLVVREGESASVDVVLTPDPGAAPCPAGETRSAEGCVGVTSPSRALAPSPEPGRDAARASRSHARARVIVPLAFGGAGVAVAAIATVIYAQGSSKYSTLKSECDAPGGCTPAVYDAARTSIKTDDALGVGGWIAGGALVASAVAWYLFSPRGAPPAPSSARIRVAPIPHGAGLAGSF